MKKVLITIISMLLPIMVSADVIIEGIYYSLNSKAKTAGVTKNPNKYKGKVTIPEKITIGGLEYSVKIIFNSAFANCSGLTYVKIPNSVEQIDWGAFSNCSGLTSVVIPNSVTSIGGNVFENCSGLTYVTIGNSVTSIGSLAFRNCSSLTSITIPNSVTSIESRTFYNCSSLNSVTIGNNVTNIGESAFYACSSLTSITIPNSVTSIGNDSFNGCRNLTSVMIGNNVTSIGKRTFQNCQSLTSVTIPNSVTSIEEHAFNQCSGLTSVTIGNSVTSIGRGAFSSCVGLTSITIPNSVTSIGPRAFDAIDMTSVVSLIENPFIIYGKDGIERTFSENTFNNATLYVPIGTIEKYRSTDGWKDFTYIEEANISGSENKTYTLSITATGNGSVSYNGTNVINSTETFSVDEGISAKVFFNPDDGYQIARATMNGRNIADLSTMSFTIDIMDEDVTIEVEFEAISTGNGKCGADVYYSYDETTQTLTISGNGEMSDYDDEHNKAPWSFYASEIKKIKIESGITTIGNFTFYKCRNITSLTIPATVTSIGSSAFEDCKNLTDLSLSDGLEYIGGSAFEGCIGLKDLSIPSTVNVISINAFKKCTGITDVYCYAKNVPNTDENAFDGTPTERSTLHVPQNSVGAYRNSWPWSDFKTIVPIEGTNYIQFADANVKRICVSYWDKNGDGELSKEEAADVTSLDKKFSGQNIKSFNELEYFTGLTSIGESAFEKCSSLASVTIPSHVKSIGNIAFSGCSRLTSVTVPSSVTSIGSSAFSNCSSLTSVAISNSVTSIGSSAFSGCSGLTSVTIPNGVTSIERCTFYNCTKLTTVTIPNGVKEIGVDAFSSCSSLISIDIPNSVTSIGYTAFEGCWNLSSVIIGSGVTSIACDAFYGGTNTMSIYSRNTDPSNIDANAFFHSCYTTATLYVPFGSKSAYQSKTGWSKFQNIVEMDQNRKLTLHVATAGTLSNLIPGNEMSVEELTLTGELNGTDIKFIWNMLGRGWKYMGTVTEGTPYYPNSTEGKLRYLDIADAKIVSGGDWYYTEDHGSRAAYYSTSNNTISEKMFYYCKNLTTIKLPNSVTSIGDYAFSGCSGLTSITIPNSVTSIGRASFSGCTNMADIYVLSTTPIELREDPFGNNLYQKTTLHVPSGCLNDYSTADYWKNFVHIVDDIEPSAFMSPTTTDEPMMIYDLNGRRLPHLIPGVNIIKYKNGEVKKRFIRMR